MKRYLIIATVVGLAGLAAAAASIAKSATNPAPPAEPRRSSASRQQSVSASLVADRSVADTSSSGAQSWRMSEQDRATLRSQLYQFGRGAR